MKKNHRGDTTILPAARKAELDARGMAWRITQARDITDSEAETRRSLEGVDLARDVVRLAEADATQKSMATALSPS
ncbi:hypothetical protein ACFRKB_29130 [Streptomyces scopuliridis]|uniref:hypothetical protein n=1 Tax=Streptomyces scopuliridis TaxID=452529 RepID=UPI003693B819